MPADRGQALAARRSADPMPVTADALAHRVPDVLPAAPTAVWDQSTAYGQSFAGVYDQLFPAGADADRTALALRGLTSGGAALELGVGTGRVAVPLAATGTPVTGVDSSPDLLARAARAAALAGVRLELRTADLRTWSPTGTFDLVYCVCATISMFATRVEQRHVLKAAASALRPGAHLVLETHSPARVLALHANQRSVLFSSPVPHLPGGMLTRSTLQRDGGRWSLRHSWWAGGTRHEACEHSLLTSPEVLDQMASTSGLHLVERWSDWRGSAPHALSPTYVSVYQRPG